MGSLSPQPCHVSPKIHGFGDPRIDLYSQYVGIPRLDIKPKSVPIGSVGLIIGGICWKSQTSPGVEPSNIFMMEKKLSARSFFYSEEIFSNAEPKSAEVWFQHIFVKVHQTPKIGEEWFPFWLIFFSDGLVKNHQLANKKMMRTCK